MQGTGHWTGKGEVVMRLHLIVSKGFLRDKISNGFKEEEEAELMSVANLARNFV